MASIPIGAVARERIDGWTITAACNNRGDLILNAGRNAWHMTPETARHIQHELGLARIMHATRFGEDADE